MKFVSYTRCGRSGFGLVVEGGIVELAGRLDAGVTTLRQAIAADILAQAEPYAQGRRAELGWSGQYRKLKQQFGQWQELVFGWRRSDECRECGLTTGVFFKTVGKLIIHYDSCIVFF